MTEPLQLTLNPTPQNQSAAATWLTQRMFGLGTIIVMMTAFQIGGLIATLLLSLATGQPFRAMLPAVIVAVFGASMALILFQNWVNRRAAAELARSALRQTPSRLTLAPQGLTVASDLVPWDKVGSVLRWRDHSLITFSRLDAILIPDADLPAGLTPETLAARITDWKA